MQLCCHHHSQKTHIYRFICHGLVTGETYVFRVRAVNAAGLSQFSQESEPVEVKAAIGEWAQWVRVHMVHLI